MAIWLANRQIVEDPARSQGIASRGLHAADCLALDRLAKLARGWPKIRAIVVDGIASHARIGTRIKMDRDVDPCPRPGRDARLLLKPDAGGLIRVAIGR